MIDSAFIERVLHSKNIVSKNRRGNLVRSTAHTTAAHKLIANHLGGLRRKFLAGVYEERRMENMDETHFWYDIADWTVLPRKGAKKVK